MRFNQKTLDAVLRKELTLFLEQTQACKSTPTTDNVTFASPFGTPLPANTSASDLPTTSRQHRNHVSDLSPGAKAGIITGASVVLLAVFLLLLELTCLCRKRRERALRRAVEEVERGNRRVTSDRIDEDESEGETVMLERGVEVIGQEVVKEVEDEREGVVLESKVEIVVEDEGGWETDEDDEEWGRGREGEG